MCIMGLQHFRALGLVDSSVSSVKLPSEFFFRLTDSEHRGHVPVIPVPV